MSTDREKLEAIRPVVAKLSEHGALDVRVWAEHLDSILSSPDSGAGELHEFTPRGVRPSRTRGNEYWLCRECGHVEVDPCHTASPESEGAACPQCGNKTVHLPSHNECHACKWVGYLAKPAPTEPERGETACARCALPERLHGEDFWCQGFDPPAAPPAPESGEGDKCE